MVVHHSGYGTVRSINFGRKADRTREEGRGMLSDLVCNGLNQNLARLI